MLVVPASTPLTDRPPVIGSLVLRNAAGAELSSMKLDRHGGRQGVSERAVRVAGRRSASACSRTALMITVPPVSVSASGCSR